MRSVGKDRRGEEYRRTYAASNCRPGSFLFYRPVVLSQVHGLLNSGKAYLDTFFEVGEVITQGGSGVANEEPQEDKS